MVPQEILRQIGIYPEPVNLSVSVQAAFVLLANIQMAARLPYNTGPGAQLARLLAADLANAIIAHIPEARELIEQGWNPQMDMTNDEFESYQQTGVPPTRSEDESGIAIAQASNFLLDYARQKGHPIVLGCCPSMSGEQDLQQGDFDHHDLNGVTIAIPCNPAEAREIIVGVQQILNRLAVLDQSNRN